jgi:hypothetical protein
MIMANSFQNLNWLAIIVATISTFAIGSLWYSKLMFGKRWMKESGVTEESARKRNPIIIFGPAFVLMLVAAFFLALFIGSEADASFGAFAGLMAGIGWVATFLAITYLFEGRSMVLFLINAGYCIVTLTIMGLILGAWQ